MHHIKVQPGNVKIAIICIRENSGLHCTFGFATLKYSLGIIKLLKVQPRNNVIIIIIISIIPKIKLLVTMHFSVCKSY